METLPTLPAELTNALAWLAILGAGLSVASSCTTAIVIRRKREGLDVPRWLLGLEITLSVLAINLGRTLAGKKASK